MAIDVPDVRRRVFRMRRPDISTDDLGPAMDRAGRTLRDWRKSTETALASLGDLSLDSLPQVSLDSLPGRRRPSPMRRAGPVIAIGVIGVLAGLMIGWWMGSMARMSPAATGKAGAWRGRGRWSRNLDVTSPDSQAADAGWSVGGQSSTKPAATSAAKVSDAAVSPAMTGHLGEGRDLDTDSQPGDTWRGVGPGRSSEPAGTPEFASRTVRGD